MQEFMVTLSVKTEGRKLTEAAVKRLLAQMVRREDAPEEISQVRISVITEVTKNPVPQKMGGNLSNY